MANKFNKIPLSPEEKEKKAENFINFSEVKTSVFVNKNTEQIIAKKENTKLMHIRVPESFNRDLQEIACLCGLSINAVCLELLRPSIKRKLKELKEI